MKFSKVLSLAPCGLLSFLIAFSGWAADYPTPKEGSWTVRDFQFHTGETLPELHLNYITLGDPAGYCFCTARAAPERIFSVTISPANYSAPDSLLTPSDTSSSFRTPSGRVNHRSRPMVCE